jgi:hypothetical protein
MSESREPCIQIEDLPTMETLNDQEAEQIVGAGRPCVRLEFEPLEDRQLLSASALSTLPIPGTHTAPTVQFTLTTNMHMTETVGNAFRDLGSAAGGQLFQSHDAAGHRVVYVASNGHLYEFKPDTGFGSFTQVGSTNNNEIVQDKSLDLFFEQAGALYEATGVPAAVPTGGHLLARKVDAVYQARDSAGRPAAYALAGGELFQVTGGGLQQVTGLAILTQVKVNAQGQLFALKGTGGLFTVSGTTATQIDKNVTFLVLDFAGNLIHLHGDIGSEYGWAADMTDASGSPVERLLGYATSGEQHVPGVPGAWVVHFQGGDIYWSADTGACTVYGAIRSDYAASAHMTDAYGAPVQKVLGLPTDDEQSLPGVPGARVVYFEGGAIYWSPTTGAHAVYGAIGDDYAATANMTDAYGHSVLSILGAPTSDEQVVPAIPWARVMHFQGGAIYWSEKTGAHVLYGAIGARYAAAANMTAADGTPMQIVLGLPTSDEQTDPTVAGGRLVHFQGGTISWSAATGARILTDSAISQQWTNALQQGARSLPSIPTDGNIDLSQTSIAQKVVSKLYNLAQGNERSAGVDSLSVDLGSGDVSGTFWVRHRQVAQNPISSVIDGVTGWQTDVVYDDTMHGSFDYNVYSQQLTGTLDLGHGVTLDLTDVEEALQGDVTNLLEDVAGIQRTSGYNDWIHSQPGQNIYYASQNFVDWAGPETVASWTAEAIATGGTSLASIPADVAAHLSAEASGIANWLSAKLGSAAADFANQVVNALASQQNISTPYFDIRWQKIDYTYASVLFPGLQTPPVSHLGFEIVLHV